MKMSNISLKLLPFLLLALFFNSCLEDREDAIEGLGNNFVRLPEAGNDLNLLLFTSEPGVKTLNLLQVIRDVNSNASLSAPATINLQLDKGLIDEYNAAHNETFEELPSNLYEIDPLNVSLGSGEFAKTLQIKVDPTNLDLSKKYAIGVSVADGGGYQVRSGLGSALFRLIIKNQYDGKYTATGTMVDFSNAALTGLYPLTFDLVTNGANEVIVYERDRGIPAHSILSSGSTSYYGSFGLILNFDPATGKITQIRNYYGTAPDYVSGNGRSAELDPSGENTFDLASKTIKIKYWLNQPSVITPHRVEFDETWVYAGAR